MSGSSNIIACKKCGKENSLHGKAATLALVCKHCGVYFRRGTWNKDITSFHINKDKPCIPIGSKGKIDGMVYQVLGYVVKKELKYKYTWREYLLLSPYHGYAFLSEYNGNWNFLWPIESDPKNGSINTTFEYQEKTFNLFQRYKAEVIYAEGEFLFDIVDITDSTQNSEYISPPSLLGLEHSADSVLWYEGEYIKVSEVADAFGIPENRLPRKNGRGYTEPLIHSFSEKTMINITALMILLLFVAQMIFINSAEEKVVFKDTFNQADLNEQKVFVSRSFNLEEPSQALEINLYAPVDNDWFFGEFSLINETTGKEYNFTKELEYYHGVEDGYSWSEGSTHGDAFLSSIEGGQYHINIYPEFSNYNHAFNLVVKSDVYFMSNFFISIIAILLFPVGYYIRKNMIERRRWSESDYSPYAYDEDK